MPTVGPRPTASQRAAWHHQRKTELGPQAVGSETQKPLPTVAPATVVRLARANRDVRVT